MNQNQGRCQRAQKILVLITVLDELLVPQGRIAEITDDTTNHQALREGDEIRLLLLPDIATATSIVIENVNDRGSLTVTVTGTGLAGTLLPSLLVGSPLLLDLVVMFPHLPDFAVILHRTVVEALHQMATLRCAEVGHPRGPLHPHREPELEVDVGPLRPVLARLGRIRAGMRGIMIDDEGMILGIGSVGGDRLGATLGDIDSAKGREGPLMLCAH